jgi:ubiquinol-cytochrome c reductase iron-sulfur subunit
LSDHQHTPDDGYDHERSRAGTRIVVVSFALSMLASIGLIPLYLFSAQNQAEGVLLAVALGGLGVGMVAWSTHVLQIPDQMEERAQLRSSAEARSTADSLLDSPGITRRSMLLKLLGGAGGVLGAALAIPALSLGPHPGEDLFKTQWRPGSRVVDPEGNPLKPDSIGLRSVTTVYPEHKVDSGDSQAVLVRVDPSQFQLPKEQMGWTVDGIVVYSKVCTHAGCPVSLYRSQANQLLCPCHQSTFNVLDGGKPIFGPAKRPLPQLPIGTDPEGYLVATADFQQPVGPSFWDIKRNE